ncbi:hypothetical protein [Anaerovorax sp. IOR16]|uniref:hypothetical protein n=1 Tax=Anaerovorax sp. IOR16 TaxID=2773458 RepID=UPI0019D07FC8|nr:hypothetical protein [Anaerovorax sp. IOR16]
MKNSIEILLNKCESQHIANLWMFYRDYFESDKSCVEFLLSVFDNEPNQNDGEISVRDSCQNIFIPRRMVNTTMRLVLAARDMEVIRKGKDVFKIIYLVSCIETLQTLRGKGGWEKWKMIIDFFVKSTSDTDKETIKMKFKRSLGDDMYNENSISACPDQKICIEEFANIINILRNCAAHQGEYWNFSFCTPNNEDYGLICLINIDIGKTYINNYESISKDEKEKLLSHNGQKPHVYEIMLTYREFESIFVRTCIRFIKSYIKEYKFTLQ